MSLAAANALLKSQPDQALVALLDVWRTARHPRIAELIDLVSARVASAQPIPGKSVGERDDAWREIAKRKHPNDLPRLLREPWPSKWRNARPLLDLLDRWPDDPRLAAALVRTAANPPYDSNASEAFFKLVFEKLAKLADLRGLSVLQDLAERGPWRTFARDAANAIERRFPEGPPAIPDETALAAAEALFVDDVASAGAEAARGEALLAAIYETPDDDAARAVYGDWLVERGDPRGELVALQLARDPKLPASKRERALLDEHGRSWAGELGKLFDPESHVFDRGFFAGGSLRTLPVDDDRAARLVRVLSYHATDEVILQLLERFPSLRSLSTTSATVAMLAARPQPLALTRITFWADDITPERAAVLAECAAFPALRELEVFCAREQHARWLVDAPVLDRLDSLAINGEGATLAVVTALLKRPLRAFAFCHDQWDVAFVRDTPREPFGACRLESRRRTPVNLATDLANTLACIPADIPRIEIDSGVHTFRADQRAHVAPALARFTNATIVVPWDDTAPIVEAAPVVTLTVYGRGLLDPELIGPFWNMLAELDQRYDSFIVGSGKASKPLGDDPLARIATWIANPKTEKLTLRHTERLDRALISAHKPDSRFSSYKPDSQRTEIDLVARTGVAAIPHWFARLATLVGCEWGTCSLPKRDITFVHFGSQPVPIGWLTLVPAALAERHPFHELDGVSVVREPATIIVAAPTPAEATPERIAALAVRMRAFGAQ